MNSLLYYLIQVIVASAILYLYYHLALRNKKFHQYNRFYLLGAIIISILVPFLNIPVYFSQQETQSSFVLQTLTVISSPDAEQEVDKAVRIAETPVIKAFDPANLLYYGYALLALLALVKIIFSLSRIRTLKKNNPVEKIDTISFINTAEPGTPFSFFRWLFWNKNIELRSEKGEQIFRHELFHIQQKHSIDLLFIELLTVVFWINPFFHIMKKELRAIHEFLADQFAMNKSNKWDYAELLLMQALQTKYSLVNPFFHNQIRRRIAMITKPEKTSFRYLRKLLVLPVAVLIITAFAFKYKQADADTIVPPADPITVIIDAGHGGIDPGAKSPDNKFNEAQLSLELAKKIQELSSEYNIKVVLTREADVLPGAATNANDGNRNRVKIADEVKPAAFIALHINSAMKSTNSGIEAYVSGTRDDEGGRKIASAILQELSTIYKTANELKIRKHTGIHVLDKNSCPAVILQCGYITNPADLAFITDKSNQEKIARRILAALSRQDNYTAELSPIPSQRAQHDTDKVILTKVEIEAQLPGGEKAWRVFLEKNLDANVPFNNHAKPGTYTVFIQFIVDKEGKASDFKALTAHGYGMEEEAIKALKRVPEWLPAIHNGNKVNAYKRMPITYCIIREDKVSTSEKQDDYIMPTGFPVVTILPEVFIGGYISRRDKEVSHNIQKMAAPVELGSWSWKQYLQNNLDGMIPVREGWKPGQYKLLVHFTIDEKGIINDVAVQNYPGSETATSCLELFRSIGKVSPPAQVSVNGKMLYTQAVTFNIAPTITVSELRTTTVHQLLGIDKSAEIKSFIFSIDLSNNDMVQSVNQGGQFNKETLRLMREAAPGRLITVDNIRIMQGGRERPISAKLYEVISDNYAHSTSLNDKELIGILSGVR